MAALLKDRPGRIEKIDRAKLPLKAATKVYKGGAAVADIGALSASRGFITKGAAAADLLAIGRFSETIDNTGANGAKSAEVIFPREIHTIWWDNDTGTPVVAADRFSKCYFVDDHTVTSDPTGSSVAGIVFEVHDTLVAVIPAAATEGFDASTAADVPIVDALGKYTSGNVEGALAEATTTAELADTGGADLIGFGSITVGDKLALPDVEVFDVSGTWSKPDGCTTVHVIAIGGGGGGGSGGNDTSDSGGGGGAGGTIVEAVFKASEIGATVTVTIGDGGTGGAAKAVAGDGNDGTDGAASTFGTLLSGPGGAKGLKGTNASGTAGAALTTRYVKIGGAGGAGNDDSAGVDGERSFAGGGGGGGGGIDTSNRAGGAGGGQPSGTTATAGGGTAGAAPGGAGGAGAAAAAVQLCLGGAGGGGGAGRAAGGNGGAGAVGGVPGGGGGGSGAGGAGVESGVGGAGGKGRVVVIAY
jgi:hypothetical protein